MRMDANREPLHVRLSPRYAECLYSRSQISASPVYACSWKLPLQEPRHSILLEPSHHLSSHPSSISLYIFIPFFFFFIFFILLLSSPSARLSLLSFPIAITMHAVSRQSLPHFNGHTFSPSSSSFNSFPALKSNFLCPYLFLFIWDPPFQFSCHPPLSSIFSICSPIPRPHA